MNLFSHLGFARTGLTLAAVAALAGAALPAAAQTGTFSVFSTGVDSGGAALASGTSGDPHYTLVANPVGTSSSLEVLTSAYGFPIVPGGWLGDSSTSAWIAPTNTPFVGPKPGGEYEYQTTFTLANFDPATETASLTGLWATDNFGTDILINGLSTGSTASSSSSYTPFRITGGFQPGLNTLDFLVVDDGQGATGLRVDGLSGNINPVPEASTTVSLGLLLALGLGSLTIARRKRAA